MPEQFHILLPTDVFPPVAGGAGWSSHALARALLARGHRVTAIVPRRGTPGIRRCEVAGVPIVEVGYRAPRVPFVQNYYRFELLWPLLRNVIVAEAYRERDLPIIIHGQHAQTIPAAVLAGHELGVLTVATIRDAWPWHYFATGLLGDGIPFNRDNPWTTWLDLIGRLGPLNGVLAAPAIPYIRRHVQRRAALLAQADGVIACSGYIRAKLDGIVPDERLHVIPHLIDVAAAQRIVQQPLSSTLDLPPRFLLFVGKLERNKGVHLLPATLAAARERQPDLPPLLIAGNGELEGDLRRELAARTIPHHFLAGWTDHDDVLRLMRRADVLLYPSAWGEPLTRVLVEASVVGSCIVALDTGGTSDIVVDGVSGVLVNDEIALGRAVAALLADDQRRAELRRGAERIARERFAAEVVVPQVEALYESIHEATRRHAKD